MHLPEGLTRGIGRAILELKKDSPHIFFVGGAVAVVGGAVMACRATRNLDDALGDIQKDLQTLKELKEQTLSDGEPVISEAEYIKKLMKTYSKASGKFAKLYGPAMLVGGAGIAALAGSHVQMTRRNAALTATLGVLTRAYEEYREAVREDVGEERELELYRGDPNEDWNDRETNEEGLPVPAITGHSMTARCFDDINSTEWSKEPGRNIFFLRCQQKFANERLKRRGHLFLNEVYEMLGMTHTEWGALLGWVWNSETGDNVVDFMIYEPGNERFIDGHEKSVWLDFNVDGLIYNLI